MTPDGRTLKLSKADFDVSSSPQTATSSSSFILESDTEDEGLSNIAASVLCGRVRSFCCIAFVVCPLAITVAALVTAYDRGERAAAATLEAWAGEEVEEALLRRRSELQETPKTPESWRRFREEYYQRHNISWSVAKPLPAGIGSQADFWGNSWLKAEINRVLAIAAIELNKEVKAMASKKLGGNQMVENSHVMFDYFHGVETTNVDVFKCDKVESNLDEEKAIADLELRAHPTDPIVAGGRIYLGKGDSHFTFRIQVNQFWVAATRMHGQLDFGIPPVVEKVDVGWVDCGFGWLDATCYSKKNPGKVDHFCTHFMQGKLKKMHGDMIWKMSAKMTQVMQKKFDDEVQLGKQKEGISGPLHVKS